MRDIPIFTTENGVGSLVLREIPYKAAAYIKIQDVSDAEGFLEECISFCKAAGAEKIYASGHRCLRSYPLYTTILEMGMDREDMPETDACLLPVAQQTLETWRKIYNGRMEQVPNAAYMSGEDAKQMLSRSDGYFVYKEGCMIGIGIAGAEKIDAVIAVKSGMGADVLSALSRALSQEKISLEVASANIPALRLYEKLGFHRVREISRWYKLF